MIKKNIMATPTKKKKPMTLDAFAVLIQKDLSRMATKDDLAAVVIADHLKGSLWPIQRDVKTLTSQLEDVRDDVKQITDNMVSKADLEAVREALLHEMRHGKSIEEVWGRLLLVERSSRNQTRASRGV